MSDNTMTENNQWHLCQLTEVHPHQKKKENGNLVDGGKGIIIIIIFIILL